MKGDSDLGEQKPGGTATVNPTGFSVSCSVYTSVGQSKERIIKYSCRVLETAQQVKVLGA